MQNQSEERRRLERWRRPGRLDGRLAELMATAEAKVESGWNAYFARLLVVLGPDEYNRLVEAWNAGQETPADIVPKMEADEDATRLHRDVAQLDWTLSTVERGAIVSEHYWYKELGTVKPPRSWFK